MNDDKKLNSLETLSVLVVDDEVGFRELLEWELSGHGIEVDVAANGAEGMRFLEKKRFDVVITDITMPEMDGLKFLEKVKRAAPETEVIVVTGFSAVETAVYAMKSGAFDFVLKPYDLDYLMNAVRKAAVEFSKCECGRRSHEH